MNLYNRSERLLMSSRLRSADRLQDFILYTAEEEEQVSTAESAKYMKKLRRQSEIFLSSLNSHSVNTDTKMTAEIHAEDLCYPSQHSEHSLRMTDRFIQEVAML